MLCRDIMSREVVSFREMDRVDAAARRMRDDNIGFAPVCDDDGRPVGAITDRDIALRVCAHDRRAGRTHVREVMTRELLTCRATDDLEQAEDLMGSRRKNRVIILDDEGRLTGIVSLADVVERDTEDRAIQTIRRVLEREVRTWSLGVVEL
jgi:CBS domain-containing protein